MNSAIQPIARALTAGIPYARTATVNDPSHFGATEFWIKACDAIDPETTNILVKKAMTADPNSGRYHEEPERRDNQAPGKKTVRRCPAREPQSAQ